jgi:hypothetical protein
MSRAFIPVFGRRKKPPAPEAVVAAPEIKPLEWTARKRKQCELVKYKDANGNPKCEAWFYPSRKRRKCCCQKHQDILYDIKNNAAGSRWKKNNKAKVAASQKRRRANNPALRAKETASQRRRRANPEIRARQNANQNARRKPKEPTCDYCGEKFPHTKPGRKPLACPKPECQEAHEERYKQKDAANSRKTREKQKAKPKKTSVDRRRKLTDAQRYEIIKRREAGEALAAIAKSYGVSVPTIWALTTAGFKAVVI